jgi:butyrate kinase
MLGIFAFCGAFDMVHLMTRNTNKTYKGEEMKYRVLAINPGSTSTKISVFDDDATVFITTLRHDAAELDKVGSILEQDQFRKNLVMEAMKEHNVDPASLDAVVGRGGLVRPLKGGVYKINDKMLADLKDPTIWGRIHASNLGAFISKAIADELKIPCMIVDPVAVDEFEDIARISGIPEIERKSLFHALNIRFTGRKLADKLGKKFEECNFVAAHMGGGISVVAIRNGRVVDVNNALLGMGSFSPERAGALPIGDLIELSYSGKYTKKELLSYLSKDAGLTAYLGTNAGNVVTERILAGDEKAKLIFDAMIYQVAKEIGAAATVLCGKVDAIFITGGLTYGEYLCGELKKRIEFIAEVHVYPGEGEMEALSAGAVRVLKGLDTAQEY